MLNEAVAISSQPAKNRISFLQLFIHNYHIINAAENREAKQNDLNARRVIIANTLVCAHNKHKLTTAALLGL